MNNLQNTFFTPDHETFRQSLRAFLDKEVMPFIDQWEEDGQLPADIWKKFGDMGYFGLSHEEKYGGLGLDFWYDVVFLEEVSKCWSGGFGASISAHPYLTLSHLSKEGSEYLKERYLRPGIAGDKHGGLAITEPFAGSDVAGIRTTAVRDGNGWRINGSKMFITNGVTGDYLIVAAKTNPEAGAAGISLFVVDRETEGLSAANLKKLGWKASDTGDIALDNVYVPAEHLLGEENRGFYYIMQRFELERLTLALGSIAASEQGMAYTLQYMSERQAFGRSINKFQVLRHRMAQLSAELEMIKTFTYQVCRMYVDGIYAVKEASMVKLLATEFADKCVYECLQNFGGYGYMEEYKIARAFRDSRLGTIGGGSSEIMREIIAKMVIDEIAYDSPRSTVDSRQPQTITATDIIKSLPERVKKEKLGALTGNIHFDISGTGGGKYTLTLTSDECTIQEGLYGEALCVVSADNDSYVGVETGKLNPQEAFMTGKLLLSNPMVMMQVGGMFSKVKSSQFTDHGLRPAGFTVHGK
jgi:acyl-CoA dehydrogenase